MVFWDNANYATYELAAQGEDGLAVVAVLYEVCDVFVLIINPFTLDSSEFKPDHLCKITNWVKLD